MPWSIFVFRNSNVPMNTRKFEHFNDTHAVILEDKSLIIPKITRYCGGIRFQTTIYESCDQA